MSKTDYMSLGLIPIEMIKVKDRYRHDRGEIELLAESLKARGQIHPVLVNNDYSLLAGERRIEAAKSLGWLTIRAEMRVTASTNRLSDMEVELDENQIRKDFEWPEAAKLEKAIYDMRRAKDPTWNMKKQAGEREISDSLVGMRMQLAEAIELLPDLAECSTQDEAWKKLSKLKENALRGQLRGKIPDYVKNAPQWARDHYIVADALGPDGLASLPDASASFAEVDPPYGIDLNRRKSRNKDEGHTEDYSEIPDADFPAFMQQVIAETYRILKPNSYAVVWFGMQWYTDLYSWLTEAKFNVNPMCAIWYKGQSGQTAQPDMALASCYEPFFLARKGNPRMMRSGRGNVFEYAPVPYARKIHATEKPIELLGDILGTLVFEEGASILIPFMGSGVTLRAAYKLGHTGVGFDLSEHNKDRFLRKVAEEHGHGAETEDLEESED
jgi:ParB family transcriptional regulator, chromosome partitioning protein